MGKLGQAVGELTDSPIHHNPDSTIRRKVTRKKTGKICQFVRCFIHLFIPTVFKLS